MEKKLADPEYRERKREYDQQHYHNDPEYRDRQRAFKKTPARISQRRRYDNLRSQTPEYKAHKQSYYRNNRHIIRANEHRYNMRKKRLPDTFTERHWRHALTYFGHCCTYCGDQQGLWNPMTSDHFIPLSHPECPGTIPANMLPACKSCNSSKGTRDASEWLVEKYGSKKAKEILIRIETYFKSLDR